MDSNSDIRGSVMVVGSGIAGMQAALDMAKSGFYIYLVEKSPAIGGKSRPNVLLITADDLGNQLSCYGDDHLNTPRLDGLAAEGVRFTRAYVTQSSCSSSRAMLIVSTGSSR